MTAQDALNRLTFDDSIFYRMWEVAGVSFNNQSVWRFDEEVPLEYIQRFRDGLAHGPLGRLVRPSPFFGARPRWVPAPTDQPLEIETEVVENDLEWLGRHAFTEIDPVNGPGFRFVVGKRAGGGTLLTVVVNHAITDGSLQIMAELATLLGLPTGRLPDDSPEARRVSAQADRADAREQLAAAARGLGKAAKLARSGGFKSPASMSSDSTTTRPQHTLKQALAGQPWMSPMVALDIPSAALHEAAAKRGGTVNSWFYALQVGLLRSMGRVHDGDTAPISVPVALREGVRDLRSNTTSAVTIEIEVDDTLYADLSRVRTASKTAYARASEGAEEDRLGPLKPLAQLVPGWVVERAVRDAPAAMCTASNIGPMARPICTLGSPFSVTGLLARGVTRPMTKEFMQLTGGALASWLIETGPRDARMAHLSLQAMNPDLVPDQDTMTALVAEEFSRWGLSPRSW